MVTLSVQFMFLEQYGLEPSKSAAYLSYVSLPWTPKLLYGIITDVFPICGSGKRSYVFIMGMLQSMACLTMCLTAGSGVIPEPGQPNNGFVEPGISAGFLCALACINSFGGAFMDVVVDGMMVINSRNDPNTGSEELQAYSWGFYGLGGVVGCLFSGYYLSVAGGQNPGMCFGIMVGFGAAVGISGLFIDKKLEANQAEMV